MLKIAVMSNCLVLLIVQLLLLDTLWPGWLEAAQALGCAAVVTQHRLMTEGVMAQLRAAQLHGLCYTVNDADEARRLLELGISGIITDAVDRFVPEAQVQPG